MLGTGLFCVLLSGCQSSQQALEALSSTHGRHVTVLQSSPYPLAYSAPLQPPITSRLRVYVEGDGYAWATATQPSLDPSPRQLLVAKLAFNDPTPNVYLARPCQFISAPSCSPELWTDRRFSPEVLRSLDNALTLIKARHGNHDFDLVGYSGGAALALLLAAQRDDIEQVQTIAGNLSPANWIEHHGLRSLDNALEPIGFKDRLARLPQRHLSGKEDRVVPTSLLQTYYEQFDSVCFQIVVIDEASHTEGWERAWRQWQARPIVCL
ncbi:alpha/beta hydrolase [Vreelandella boliviensis LC1]|uniref:Alpha/beta hydrolase n=1 Tax=Vreelandella boliviensis LC1 TaxID=1072583 RepID=A0ABX4GF93_9GAMM|nr:alpha/beta hydrolase [Halomonas boliviensis LC1]